MVVVSSFTSEFCNDFKDVNLCLNAGMGVTLCWAFFCGWGVGMAPIYVGGNLSEFGRLNCLQRMPQETSTAESKLLKRPFSARRTYRNIWAKIFFQLKITGDI